MFDRNAYIETLKLAMKDWPLEKIEAHADERARKFATVKTGENVIHITHAPSILDSTDLTQIEYELQTNGKELSSYNTGGEIMASVQEIISDVILYLNNSTVQEVVFLGLGTNALWDAIKSV